MLEHIVLQTDTLVGIVDSMRQLVSNMGPTLLMPIIIFIFGLTFRVTVQRAFRLALLVGVGFVGIFAILDATLGPVGTTVQALTETWGLNVVGVDVGWPPIAGFTWALGVTVLMIPIGLAVNVVMLFFGWTRTFDADVWNFWHWAFNAGLVYILTGSWALAFLAGIITEVIVLRLADWTTDLAQEYFGIPGANLPHTETITQAPVAFAIDKVLRRVPVIGSVEVDPDTLEERVGVFGEPIVIGFLVGIFLGVIALQDPLQIFRTGVMVGALLTLLPRMVGLLIEGLEPIANQASTYFNQSSLFQGEDFNIGIDAGPIGLSDTTSVVAGLILVPYAVGLAFIPGVRIMPLADLAILPIFCMWAAAISGGNLVRTVANGGVIITIVTAATTWLAPYMTEMATMTGGFEELSTNAELISSLDVGGHWWTAGLIWPLGLLGDSGATMTQVGVGMAAVIFVALCYVWTRDMPQEAVKSDVVEDEQPADSVAPTDD